MAKTCAIILNYFGAQKTKVCLKSLVGQAVDTVYIVDNSASQPEADRLSILVEEISSTNGSPLIRLLFNKDNLGFGRAMNKALKYDIEEHEGHDFYILMNNDAQATPDMVERLLATMQHEKDISLIAPRILTGHGETGFFWYNRLFGFITMDKWPLSFPFLTGCCLLFRRSLIENEPLFDEDFFMYGEDAYLSWKLQNNGQKVLCAEDIHIVHEGTGSSSHGGLFYEYHIARGHILLATKTWEHSYELPLFIMGRILYLSTRALVRSLRYFNLAPIYAIFLCWFPLKIRNS
jgi:N-acetylglucosaminyl-diphospho-decaprenol L-rhamnosyltransferase